MEEFLSLKLKGFGLDISDLSLKILSFKEKKGIFSKDRKIFLESYLNTPIEKGIIEKGEIKKEDLLSKILKESLNKVKGEKIKTKYVVVSLPEEKSFIRIIQLPKMKEEEAKKAAFFEVENYIPLSLEEVYVESEIISPLYDSLDHIDVLIVAVPKKIVDSYIRVIKKAGLFPLALEVESFAIVRAIIEKEISERPIFIIDFGETRTSFIIFSGKSLKFTTTIPFSSNILTEIISKKLNLSFEKAEKIKRNYGILPISDSKKGIVKNQEILEILNPCLEDFVKEIKKYMEFYFSHREHEHLPPGKEELKEIILVGGGANLKGLPEYLSEKLKIKVFKGNPWVNILKKREKPPLSLEESLSFTTAIGLAKRAISESL